MTPTAAVLNVMNYGALADNLTDDSAAIQTAINTARAVAGGGGGKVIFPAGAVCRCESPLVLDGTISIALEGAATPEGLGVGPTAATLNHTLTGPGDFISGKGSQGLTLTGLRIMNLSPLFTGTQINLTGSGSDTSGAVIERCQIQGAAASTATATVGVKLCQANMCRLLRNQFSWMACGVLGVDQAGYSNANQLSGNQFVALTTNAAIRNAGQAWLIDSNCFEPNILGQACGYEDDLTYGAYGPVVFLANSFDDATSGTSPWIRYRGNAFSSVGDYFSSPGPGNPCILIGSTGQAIQGVAITGSSFEGSWAVQTTGAGQIFGFMMAGCHVMGGRVNDPSHLLNNPRFVGNDTIPDQLGTPLTLPGVGVLGPILALPGGVPYATIGTVEPGVPGGINGELGIFGRGDGGGDDHGVVIFAGDALQLPIARFRRNAGVTFYRPVVLPEIAAPLKNSLSVDPTTGKLVFVDRNGTIHTLT